MKSFKFQRQFNFDWGSCFCSSLFYNRSQHQKLKFTKTFVVLHKHLHIGIFNLLLQLFFFFFQLHDILLHEIDVSTEDQ